MNRVVLVLLLLSFSFATPAASRERCPNDRSRQAAMWLSIAHPGVGEYYLKGWGGWDQMPQKKFWYGFIPFYGWPGYLQAKSAHDAFHCKTNDDLTFRD